MNQDRYARQIGLPEIGQEGQEKLRKARVLLVGVGGLGAPISLYLAGAGIGCLGIVDDDVVSASNLHRQVLYSESQVGASKVECAALCRSFFRRQCRSHLERLRFGGGRLRQLCHPLRH